MPPVGRRAPRRRPLGPPRSLPTADAEGASGCAPRAAGPRPRMSARLVVADDDDALRALLGAALAAYTVLTAARGDEALALVRRERPDLVVLDVQMPGLDGLGVARALAADPATAAIPVVLCSGAGPAAARRRGGWPASSRSCRSPSTSRSCRGRSRGRWRPRRLCAGTAGPGGAPDGAARRRPPRPCPTATRRPGPAWPARPRGPGGAAAGGAHRGAAEPPGGRARPRPPGAPTRPTATPGPAARARRRPRGPTP